MKSKLFKISVISILLALALCGEAFAQTCTPPPSGMVAWLPGDGNAHDISPGSNNNGFVGTQTAFPAGKVAQTFQFNGSATSQISIMTTDGRGIRNVRLTLTNPAGETRTVLSSAFGYYRFAEVPSGGTYILSASGKRFIFEQPTRILYVGEDLNDVNFVALPNKYIGGAPEL